MEKISKLKLKFIDLFILDTDLSMRKTNIFGAIFRQTYINIWL